jgi:hypothetical protein
MLLWRPQSDWCGAVRATAGEIVENLPRLLSVGQHDVWAISVDEHSLGVVVLAPGDHDVPTLYEVAVWRNP